MRPQKPLEQLKKSLERYRAEQAEDSSPVPLWQQVVSSIYFAIQAPDQLRWVFDDPDFSNAFFADGLFGFWASFSLWMSPDHASELVEMYSNGILETFSPLSEILWDNGKPVLVSSQERVPVDWVVNAANASPHISDITREDSELWANLRDEGKLMLLNSRPGNSGFGIEKNTYKLLSSQLRGTYIVGGPMVWFASDIATVNVRAKAVVTAITKELVGSKSPSLPRSS